MPGTTRYSATFDRLYEEEERALTAAVNGSRRSRSQSCVALPPANNGHAKHPLDALSPADRSASTDRGQNPVDRIPTRTVAKTTVKTHNNPFQFVKVGTSPLYKKAEEQLKKVKEIKKPEVVKEDAEEWQSNLDSWKSRRRKMSEDVFRRQEEIRQLEMEEQTKEQVNQKKIKTFSEMVESRAHRGRAMSLSLISSTAELQNWESENHISSNPFSEESEENSAINSEDEGVGVQTHCHTSPSKDNRNSVPYLKTPAHVIRRNKANKFFGVGENGHHREGVYVDSGLESISSSHRAGDTPDSCSDFSQDSSSSVDYDSPRVSGLILNDVNLLEEFNKSSENGFYDKSSDSYANMQSGKEVVVFIGLGSSSEDFGFSFEYIENSGQLIISSVAEGSAAQSCGVKTGDQILSINEITVEDKTHSQVCALLAKAKNESRIDLLLWRQAKDETLNKIDKTTKSHYQDYSVGSTESCSPKYSINSEQETCNSENHNRSMESENEVFVDNFEALNNNSPVICSKDENISLKTERMSNANIVLVNQNTEPNAKNFEEASLNIIFQSKPSKNVQGSNIAVNGHGEVVTLFDDIPPVEQVAQEMERLILEQLEEEERAKELSAKILTSNLYDSPEHNFTSPPRLAQPPKEKPPPPPSLDIEVQKPVALKRVNSTKRIKKEICKRRSNFLGIDNSDENDISEELIRPPPALEQILKAEMELDRENMKRLDHAAEERLKQEEREMFLKEQEIIENLEMEERQKNLVTNQDICDFLQQEEERIKSLKEEKLKLENARRLEEEHRMRLEEEKHLQEREEFIKKQEVESSTLSAPLLSDSLNAAKSFNASLSEAQPQQLSGVGGEGESMSVPSLSNEISAAETSVSCLVMKPAVPPKPFKKKEAIRKERERLRQEQEELQREREEHRRKLEQEEMLKIHPKPHASEIPISQLAPPLPLAKSNSQPLSLIAQSVQSQHFSQNGIPSSTVGAEPVVHVGKKPLKPAISHHKPVHSELWKHQKIQPTKKQTQQETTLESKYNQNHWLIQEAEMRRIAELKERQRQVNSQAHLAEDDACSRIPPPQENSWQYGPPVNMPVKKCPPPIPSEKPILPYPREVVPPAKPSRLVPVERQEQMLSVSGRKRCSHCNEELGRGAAMIIESLQLCYHIQCFQCCVCQSQLGNGSCGTDVRVRNNKLHCHNCYSNDEAGLKFSQV